MLITGTLPASITLQTVAPFVLEGTCLLIIFTAAILLAVPLASHIGTLLLNHGSKSNENLNGIFLADGVPPLPSAAPELCVIHASYPTPVSRSSEESIVRKTGIYTPALSESGENLSSNFNPMQLYDSGLVSYDSYRHKLIDETLQKQYGGGYAPGNVILNLIELNTADSVTSVILAKKYDKSFFDEIKIREAVASLCSDSRINCPEYPDPLAHFIPKNMLKPSTTEIQTETAHPSEISIVENPINTSCQRIIRKRSANCNKKSPFPTPVNSRAPINPQVSLSQRTRDQRSEDSTPPINTARDLSAQAPLTEQLYKRNDTRPDVVSKTHVEAEEYLNRIANNKPHEISEKRMIQEPRIRSSLKKSKHNTNGGKKGSVNSRCLSTSKPAIWNN